jgi:hypothetical protein
MPATKTVGEVKRTHRPEVTEPFFNNENRWRLRIIRPDRPPEELPVDTDWVCTSPFGTVRNMVVVDDDGTPVFDRPEYCEAPNVNVVVWGRNTDGTVKLAVISQPSPHADDPRMQPNMDCDPIVFGQIVMGFSQHKVFGDDVVNQFESAEEAAARETGEEAGANVILNVEVPPSPWHNPNPTFVATWSDLLFVEVDLEALEAIKSDRDEPIYKAEFVDVPTLLKRIAAGVGPDDELYRMCTANSAWMIFFAIHPELFMV